VIVSALRDTDDDGDVNMAGVFCCASVSNTVCSAKLILNENVVAQEKLAGITSTLTCIPPRFEHQRVSCYPGFQLVRMHPAPLSVLDRDRDDLPDLMLSPNVLPLLQHLLLVVILAVAAALVILLQICQVVQETATAATTTATTSCRSNSRSTRRLHWRRRARWSLPLLGVFACVVLLPHAPAA
jgi:hypothetical protein